MGKMLITGESKLSAAVWPVSAFIFLLLSHLLGNLPSASLFLEKEHEPFTLHWEKNKPDGPLDHFEALREWRSVVADFIYLEIDRLWHRGAYREMLPLMRFGTKMDPEFLELWEVTAWHIAFNLSESAQGEKERRRLIDEGLSVLDEAIQIHPNRYELYFDKGFIYYRRLKDYKTALHWFKRAEKYPHPASVDRLALQMERKLKGRLEKA